MTIEAGSQGYIQIDEVMRDGLQAVPEFIDTGIKLEYERRVRDAVLPGATCTVEVTAFVHPKVIPQHADASDIVARLTPSEGVVHSVLVPNKQGFDRAMKADGDRGVVGEVAAFTAASDTFLWNNNHATPEQSLEAIAEVQVAAREAGIPFVTYVSCMGFCPYEGVITPEQLRVRVDQLRELGVTSIKLGSTTGMETKDSIRRAMDEVKRNDEQYSGVEIGAHTHATRGRGLTNALAFLPYGVRRFDGSAAGVGVTRYSGNGIGVARTRLANNVASDELAVALMRRGYEVGWDITALAEAGVWLAEQTGLPIHSEFARAISTSEAV